MTLTSIQSSFLLWPSFRLKTVRYQTLRCEAVDVLESGRSPALWEDSPEHGSRTISPLASRI